MPTDRLPDEEVKVKLATCGDCGNPVMVSVLHTMSKESYKELSDCVKAGCNVMTMPLLSFKSMAISDWCDTKCKTKKGEENKNQLTLEL